jgi:pilus assembly protein Flp/PilA
MAFNRSGEGRRLAKKNLPSTQRADAPINQEDSGMRNMVTRFWKDESGQGLVEYALILFLVSIVVIIALTTLGKKTNNVLTNVGKALNA